MITIVRRVFIITFAIFSTLAAVGCCPLCKSAASVVKGRWIEFDRQACQYMPENGGMEIHWAAGRAEAQDLPEGRPIVGSQKADCCLVVVMGREGKQAFLIVEHPVLTAGHIAGNVYTVYRTKSFAAMPGDYSMISAGGPFTTTLLEFVGLATRPAHQFDRTPPATNPAGQPQLCFVIPRQPREPSDQQQQTIADIRRQFGMVLAQFIRLDQQQ